MANARHQSDLSTRRDQREHRITTARAARMLIEKKPLLARWGMAGLLRLAASVQNSRAESDIPTPPAIGIWCRLSTSGGSRSSRGRRLLEGLLEAETGGTTLGGRFPAAPKPPNLRSRCAPTGRRPD